MEWMFGVVVQTLLFPSAAALYCHRECISSSVILPL